MIDPRETFRAHFRSLADDCRRCSSIAKSMPDALIDVVLCQVADLRDLDCADVWNFWGEAGREPAKAKTRGLGKKTLALRNHIVEELAKLPELVSTRQVYYRIISAGILPNSTKSYRCVAELLVDMRDDGTIDYARIVDRGRAAVKRSAWSSSIKLMEAATEQFYLERWTAQPTMVHIALEKRALEGVFGEACREYGVPLYPFGGYASVPLLYAWSKDIKAATDRGQRVQIYYFGDFDADGLDIERAAIARLRERHGAVFSWERRGLLRADLDAPGMVVLPSKGSSPRAKSYRDTFGRIGGAELDALDPDELLRRVEDAVEPHIEREAWARIEREEQLQRADMATVFSPKNWPIAVAAARAA